MIRANGIQKVLINKGKHLKVYLTFIMIERDLLKLNLERNFLTKSTQVKTNSLHLSQVKTLKKKTSNNTKKCWMTHKMISIFTIWKVIKMESIKQKIDIEKMLQKKMGIVLSFWKIKWSCKKKWKMIIKKKKTIRDYLHYQVEAIIILWATEKVGEKSLKWDLKLRKKNIKKWIGINLKSLWKRNFHPYFKIRKCNMWVAQINILQNKSKEKKILNGDKKVSNSDKQWDQPKDKEMMEINILLLMIEKNALIVKGSSMCLQQKNIYHFVLRNLDKKESEFIEENMTKME